MLQEIIVLTVAYVVLVGLFQPSKKESVVPIAVEETPIDYFPEVEETTEPLAQTEPKAKATLANLIKEEVAKPVIAATALSPVKIATAKSEPVQGFRPDLNALGVRQLYKLASNAGIKGYKRLSKSQLIKALA